MAQGREASHSAPMHTRILLLVLFASAAASAQYQQYPPRGYAPEFIGSKVFDVTGFAGYQLNGDVSTTGGTLNIDDAPAYGGILDFRVHRYGSVELMYEYTKPTSQFRSFSAGFSSTQPFDVTSHYFQIGGLSVQHAGPLEPFFGLTIGGALYVPDTIQRQGGGTVNAQDTWRFAATLALGTKIWISDSVGIRLETRMLMPMVFNGGGFYFGTGGAGLTTSAGIPSLQFAFTGGLVFGK
jgi:opacity protein-like surface antigen